MTKIAHIVPIFLFIATALGAGAFAASTEESEPIVVTGTRTNKRLSESPVLTEIVSRNEIEQSGAGTVGELLRTKSGMIIAPSAVGGSQVRIQGLGPEYTLILIDGQRVNGRVAGAIDLSRYSLEGVERIEIVKGASSALYGSDAMAGVINIITRKPKKKWEGATDVSYGTLNSLRINSRIGVMRESWKSDVSGGWQSRDSYDLDKSNLGTDGYAYRQINFLNNNQWSVTKKLKLLNTTEVMHRRQSGIAAQADWPILDTTKETTAGGFALGPEYKMSADDKLTLKARYSFFDDLYEQDMRDADILDRAEKTKEQSGQLDLQYDRLFFDSHMLSFGGEGFYESLQSDRISGRTENRHRQAVFVQDEWFVSEKPGVVLVPGFRADFDSDFGRAFSPKVGLRYDPLKELTLRGNLGWGFRAPDFKQLYLRFENPSAGYLVEGNPKLKPERSIHTSVSADYRPNKKWQFTTNVFRNDFTDLIIADFVSAADGVKNYTYTNAAEAYTQGIENSIQTRALKYFEIQASYTYLDTRDELEKRELEGRARHQGSVTVRYHWAKKRFSAQATSRLVGERPFYVDQSTTIADPYALVDVKITKGWGADFDTYAGVRNLLNAGETEYFPVEPRVIYGGLVWRYGSADEKPKENVLI